MSAATLDPRVLASDDSRLVLSVQAPEEGLRRSTFVWIATAMAAAVAAICFLFRRYVNVGGAVMLWAALFVLVSANMVTKTVLVANVSGDQLFFERTNRLTRRRRRQHIGRLSDATAYEINDFLDTDSAMFPFMLFELKLAVPHRVTIWYTGSRDSATAVGEELLRLAARARNL